MFSLRCPADDTQIDVHSCALAVKRGSGEPNDTRDEKKAPRIESTALGLCKRNSRDFMLRGDFVQYNLGGHAVNVKSRGPET
jgi:hypothetical protein